MLFVVLLLFARASRTPGAKAAVRSAPFRFHEAYASELGAVAASCRGFRLRFFAPLILASFRVVPFLIYHLFLNFFQYLSSPCCRWRGCAS